MMRSENQNSNPRQNNSVKVAIERHLPTRTQKKRYMDADESETDVRSPLTHPV